MHYSINVTRTGEFYRYNGAPAIMDDMVRVTVTTDKHDNIFQVIVPNEKTAIADVCGWALSIVNAVGPEYDAAQERAEFADEERERAEQQDDKRVAEMEYNEAAAATDEAD